MLILSLKNFPGIMSIPESLKRMNLNFNYGKIDREIVFVIEIEGIRVETYRQIKNLMKDFHPVDISEIWKNSKKFNKLTERLA